MREIRLATTADLPRIHAIAVAGWQPIFARYRLILGEPMWHDVVGGWEEGWFELTPEQFDGHALVTEQDGQVVGFATWHYPGPALAEVGGNAVDPAFQGQGLGAAQIQAVTERFRQDGYAYARVHTGLDPAHGPARAEYRKAGLHLAVTNSAYYNYVEELARVPVPAGLAFRWAVPEDAAALRELAAACWHDAYRPVRAVLGGALYSAAFGGATATHQHELTSALTPSAPDPDAAAAGAAARQATNVRLVTRDGHLIGAALLDADETKRLGTIRSLAVHPKHRDQGVGCALCMEAFAHFQERGLAYVKLRARPGELNERVRRLTWNVGLYRELPSIDYYMYL